jgi:DNA-binding MarR family transcriptional regulator
VLACPVGPTAGGAARRHVGDQVDQLFGLVARHPLLTRPQLATILDISRARVGQLIRQLELAGWVRSIPPGDARPEVLGWGLMQRSRPVLVELTPAGRREAARRLLLPAGVAEQHHGLLGKAGSLRPFVRHLDHTLGANAVFVALVLAARRLTERGGDDALVEWRSAAACARGRFRPDGYGCYRRGPWRFGFFLEYDRGTERAGQYAAKLATYYRYRASVASRRDYESFPTLLVVTTSEAAEARFSHQAYLAQHRAGGVPLTVFLTTTARLQAHPDGALGPIWCSPGPRWNAERCARVVWLPGLAFGRARRLQAPSGRGSVLT